MCRTTRSSNLFIKEQFWTPLRKARLCPNCDAIFDDSYTFCPSCGAQHLYDTVSLFVVLNKEGMDQYCFLNGDRATLQHDSDNKLMTEKWPADDFPGFWESVSEGLHVWWDKWQSRKNDMKGN